MPFQQQPNITPPIRFDIPIMADNSDEQHGPDKDGRIKSSLVILPQEEENEADYPYRKEAKMEFEKAAKDWPEGELTPGAYGDATNDNSLHIQYLYQPADAGGLAVSAHPCSDTESSETTLFAMSDHVLVSRDRPIYWQ
jgi:hypothetical protein